MISDEEAKLMRQGQFEYETTSEQDETPVLVCLPLAWALVDTGFKALPGSVVRNCVTCGEPVMMGPGAPKDARVCCAPCVKREMEQDAGRVDTADTALFLRMVTWLEGEVAKEQAKGPRPSEGN